MSGTTMHDLRRLADEGGYPDIPTIAMRCAADEIERLRSALRGLIDCPAIADGDLLSDAWGCPESAAAEHAARAALSEGEIIKREPPCE